MKKKFSILVTILIVMSLLTGCSVDSLYELGNDVKPGKTISNHSKWIDSDIVGAVDESVKVSEKDDFHTATNRKWLLKTDLPKVVANAESKDASTFDDAAKIVKKRSIDMLYQPEDEITPTTMSQEQYNHVQTLTSDLASLLMDWDTRNAKGVEPARQSIEEIANIQSMDELSYYLTNTNPSAVDSFITLDVSSPYYSRKNNAVWISPTENWLMGASEYYTSVGASFYDFKANNRKAMNDVLGKLGYSKSDIKKIIRQSYQFESKLAGAHSTTAEQSDLESYLKSYLNEKYDLKQIEEICGDFPIEGILSTYNATDSKKFSLNEEKYMKNLATIYNENNLEKMKSFLIAKTVNNLLPYLDRESYDISQERQYIITQTSSIDEDAKGQDKIEQEALAAENVMMSDVLDEVYIARYVNASDKAALEQMVQDMVSYYRNMIQEETWLSKTTRKKAIEKLNNMTCRILYAENQQDFSALNFDTNGSLVDAYYSIENYNKEDLSTKVNQAVDKSQFDTSQMNLRTVNAFYNPGDNSINIIPAIIAESAIYDSNGSYEHNLGGIGMIIGHEISHGFDTTGSEYDKDGFKKNWWTDQDRENFQQRADQLIKYYDALEAADTLGSYGDLIKDEAIADMGGMKCTLGLAKKQDQFDYEEYFHSFARVWRIKCSYGKEQQYMEDSHPLAFLRTNVTVQQFDEFNQTFHIQKGDGMYLAKDKRINVW